MSYTGSDFNPPTDPGEVEVYTFDFTALLATGETISSTTWTIAELNNVDVSASSRLLGSASYTNTTTSQRVGNCVAGANYRLTATVVTTASQTLSQYSHIACIAPN